MQAKTSDMYKKKDRCIYLLHFVSIKFARDLPPIFIGTSSKSHRMNSVKKA